MWFSGNKEELGALFVSDIVIMSPPPTNYIQRRPPTEDGVLAGGREGSKWQLLPTGGESDKRPGTVNSNSQVQSFVFIELTEHTLRSWSLTARLHGQKTDSRAGAEQVQDSREQSCPQECGTSGQSFLRAVYIKCWFKNVLQNSWEHIRYGDLSMKI